MRSARGRSFGPMKISATTPISNSSDQPISNSIASEREWGQRGPPRGGRYSQKGPAAAITGPATVISCRWLVSLRGDAGPASTLARLGRVAAASDCDKPVLGVFDIDIDDRDSAAGAADRGGGGQARGHRRAQIIDAEIDGRHHGAEPQRDREIAGRVD